MTDSSALATLLARVEAAPGVDRELDLALGLALGGWLYSEVPGCGVMLLADGNYTYDDPGCEYPSLTESLDSALALVERCKPGWTWCLGYDENGLGKFYDAILYSPDAKTDSGECTAPRPALALLAALLKALIADTASPAHGRSQTEDEQS